MRYALIIVTIMLIVLGAVALYAII